MAAATTTLNPNVETYLASFRARVPDALQALRAAAIDRFAALGFPTTKNEDWRYTNLAPHLKAPYLKPSRYELNGWSREGEGPALVFIDGWFVPEVSVVPAGVKVMSLREALGSVPVGRFADFEKNALVALNTASFEDGAYVEIPDGAVLQQPLSIVHAATGEQPQVTYPRALIVAGRDSQARIVEHYLSTEPHFTCAVTEITAAEGANLEHYKVQMEGAGALHYGHVAARLGRSANVVSFNLALGAAMARNEIAARLEGEGAECTLNGLYVITGSQHVDNHTTLDHAAPHTTSHELYKGVLDGKSQAVFHGRIVVQPEAQKTDAIQRNRNLLLSKDAVINTKPQLEIYADDVRCTHGATVGQVDDDAVFYLRSRGIALNQARSLLTYAFASEIIDQVKVDAIRQQLGDELFRRLASSEAE